MATTKLWTAEEIAELPDDDFQYALIRGELHRMPPPKPRHGRIVSLPNRHLYGFVARHGLGTLYDQSGFLFERGPDTVLGPDLSFVQAAHVPADENAYPELAPDLVVEVISPSQTGPTIEEKVVIYLAAGVRLVWAIDPAHRPRPPCGQNRSAPLRRGYDRWRSRLARVPASGRAALCLTPGIARSRPLASARRRAVLPRQAITRTCSSRVGRTRSTVFPRP